jgi:hypothetical protein
MATKKKRPLRKGAAKKGGAKKGGAGRPITKGAKKK